MNPLVMAHFPIGLLVIGVTVAVALAGYFLFHRFISFTVTEDKKAVAMAVMPIVATIHSLLLAFSAVSVWDSYSAAGSAVVEEANAISQMARDLSVFNSTEADRARVLLKEYAQIVVDVEWPDLKRGQASQAAWDKFDMLFRAVGAMQPDTAHRQALMPEVWERTNSLVELRRDRIEASQSEIPKTLWAVVVIGTMLTFVIIYALPITRFNVVMIALLASSIGLVFFFLVAMDHPFAGRDGVTSDPFVTAIYSMDRWDQSAGTVR